MKDGHFLQPLPEYEVLFTVLPTELLDEAVPGNIRRAEHFTAFMARFVEYLKVSLHNAGEVK